MRHNFIRIILLGCLIGLVQTSYCQKSKSEISKPNIIIFLTDDQGFGDVGCYGAQGFETPHMDKLAENGIRFTNFYDAATVCTPSRAGLLTGKYPKRVGLEKAVLFPFSKNGLSPKMFNLAKMLKDCGYTTSCIGKWHLGDLPKFMPNNQGFDYFFGVPYSNDMNNYYYKDINFQSPPLPLYRNLKQIGENPDQRYLTQRYTEEAIERIKNRGDKPFFIYLAHNMPHEPIACSPSFAGKSKMGLYGDVIMELDWSLGEIIKTLKEEGIYDNTIFLFTSDNGPVLGQGGSAGPLRGHKAQTWEGGERVPGIIVWPNVIPAGKVCQQFATTLDLLPTLAKIVGYSIPKNLILDGRDISDLLKNPEKVKVSDRPFIYYARNGMPEAIQLGNWKLHIAKSLGWDTKIEGIPFPISLYNLKDDIGEKNNVAELFPEKVKELSELLEKLDKNIYQIPE